MTEQEIKDFESEMKILCEKYQIQNASFSANTSDEKFLAFVVGEVLSAGQFFEITMNVGRLWQNLRTITKKKLDAFERGWHDKT